LTEVNSLRPREHAPELLSDERVAEGVGDGGELWAQQPDQRDEMAPPPPGHRGTEQAQALHLVGSLQADLDGHPPAERVPDQVGSVDPHTVHEATDRAGEPRRVVGGAKGLGGGAEAGQVDGVDGVLGREGRDGLVEARLVAAETVDQDHGLDPVAGGQG
jgi:hypothetical protein